MTTEEPSPGGSPIKVAGLASIGAAIEWYDFFIYGTAAALVFPKLFFPPELPLFVAQIAAFSTFAVGFVARPIGGAICGHVGDLYGRKRALVATMLVMGLATTAIGLLPGYASAGVLAPLLLVVFRFVQGLAVGGQWGGAALLAIESAPAHRRGYFSSFVQIGVPLGVVLANLVFLLVGLVTNARGFAGWGWRVAFLGSIALVGVSFYMNRNLTEPEGVVEARPAGSPIAAVLRRHWREVMLAGGAFVANNTCFYVAITYAVAYGATTAGLPRETMLAAVTIASLAMIPALIGCGALSDRFGRRGIFLVGAVLSAAWAFAIFPLIDTGSPALVTLAIGVELACISLMYGPQAALFAELFPREVRYSGASLGYQIGSVIGGGFAPIVATALVAHYHSSRPIAVYLSAMCFVSFACVLVLARRVGEEQR